MVQVLVRHDSLIIPTSALIFHHDHLLHRHPENFSALMAMISETEPNIVMIDRHQL